MKRLFLLSLIGFTFSILSFTSNSAQAIDFPASENGNWMMRREVIDNLADKLIQLGGIELEGILTTKPQGLFTEFGPSQPVKCKLEGKRYSFTSVRSIYLVCPNYKAHTGFIMSSVDDHHTVNVDKVEGEFIQITSFHDFGDNGYINYEPSQLSLQIVDNPLRVLGTSMVFHDPTTAVGQKVEIFSLAPTTEDLLRMMK